MHLLKKGEIEEIYRIPEIDERDRSFVFSLNDAERKILSQLHTLSSKVAFVLQFGFFRIKNIFYPIDELDKLEDLKEYVIDPYFSDYPSEKFPCFPQIKPGFSVPSLNITKPTRLSQQNQILDLFNYKKCFEDVMTLVKKEVDRLSQIHARPSYIVRELLRFFARAHPAKKRPKELLFKGDQANYILQPKGIINRELVEKEWDNILRIMVSLGMKITSQSIIVRKLNAYSRKNRTLRALEELNKILKSMHIMRYMDVLKFRQYIQKALNRGESYHNLKKAIFYL